MSKKSLRSSAYLFSSSAIVLLVTVIGLSGCDRGATEQVQAAQRFADHVTRNEVGARDSMVATWKFREFFTNEFVTDDYIKWFRTFYDLKERKFVSTARADVDRDFRKQLAGALVSDAEIEETGMVRVKVPNDELRSAFFWMVKQKDTPWRVAMVTKGDMIVHFIPEE